MTPQDPAAVATAKWLYERGIADFSGLSRPVQAKATNQAAPAARVTPEFISSVQNVLRQRQAWDARHGATAPNPAACDACAVLGRACRQHTCSVCGNRMSSALASTHPCCAEGDFDPLANGWELTNDLEWVRPIRSVA
jgi:hypothetical protein